MGILNLEYNLIFRFDEDEFILQKNGNIYLANSNRDIELIKNHYFNFKLFGCKFKK
jgi:hypothetical protein